MQGFIHAFTDTFPSIFLKTASFVGGILFGLAEKIAFIIVFVLMAICVKLYYLCKLIAWSLIFAAIVGFIDRGVRYITI